MKKRLIIKNQKPAIPLMSQKEIDKVIYDRAVRPDTTSVASTQNTQREVTDKERDYSDQFAYGRQIDVDNSTAAKNWMHAWYENPVTQRIMGNNMKAHNGYFFQYTPKSYINAGLDATDNTTMYFGNTQKGDQAMSDDGVYNNNTGTWLRSATNKARAKAKLDVVQDWSSLTPSEVNSVVNSKGVNGESFGVVIPTALPRNYYLGPTEDKANVNLGLRNVGTSNAILINTKGAKYKDYPKARIPLIIHELTHTADFSAPKLVLRDLMHSYGLQGKGSEPYADGAEEGMSKINEIRSGLGMSPQKRDYKPEDIPAMMQQLYKTNPNVYNKTYGRWSNMIGKDKANEFMSTVFNTVAKNDTLDTNDYGYDFA